ncbi:MAG: hypothetical protein JSW63_10585 [Ignavibacterium sp.]|nr:MAG: hypothetical protein JSW63_10585 [Ignavibacterium sp.]
MIKSLPILLLLIFQSAYSQSSDTLYNQTDSLKVDTTLVNAEYDSTSVDDSTAVVMKAVAPDSLISLQEYPLAQQSRAINKSEFYFYNYWYTGDFLRIFSLNFIKDQAFLGQPNETFIYGTGFGGISFLEDGVLWNDRYNNALDLNQVQSEEVDSIEIVPSPRGFLYGAYNNPVTVNFIMKDFITAQPYSRIRYYEGPFGEAMIDGMFSAKIYKRWKLSFQITNRSSDDRYINSAFSSWQVNGKLKYYLSNSFNLTALYSYVDSDVGLNGGVDVDSISNLTEDINSILYDNIIAPVLYPNRIQSVLNHNLGLRLQALPFRDARLGFTLYYRDYKDEINDEDTVGIKNTNNTETYGATLNYNHRFNMVSFQVLGTYENNKTINNNEGDKFYNQTYDYNYLSLSGILSFHILNDRLTPAVFYNYSSKEISDSNSSNSMNRSGLGIDLQLSLQKNFAVYLGYSSFEQTDSHNPTTVEFGGRYSNQNLKVDIKIFSRNDFVPYQIQEHNVQIPPSVSATEDVTGLGIVFNYQYWKLLLETNTTYYVNIDGNDISNLPDLQITGGLFVNDMFFDNNLYLKAGLIYYYTGNIKALAENVGIVDVEPSHKLDFSAAGEIRGVAIVYFAWENLFNNQYYVTPFYPMRERNIRFGLAWELFD